MLIILSGYLEQLSPSLQSCCMKRKWAESEWRCQYTSPSLEAERPSAAEEERSGKGGRDSSACPSHS